MLTGLKKTIFPKIKNTYLKFFTCYDPTYACKQHQSFYDLDCFKTKEFFKAVYFSERGTKNPVTGLYDIVVLSNNSDTVYTPANFSARSQSNITSHLVDLNDLDSKPLTSTIIKTLQLSNRKAMSSCKAPTHFFLLLIRIITL